MTETPPVDERVAVLEEQHRSVCGDINDIKISQSTMSVVMTEISKSLAALSAAFNEFKCIRDDIKDLKEEIKSHDEQIVQLKERALFVVGWKKGIGWVLGSICALFGLASAVIQALKALHILIK